MLQQVEGGTLIEVAMAAIRRMAAAAPGARLPSIRRLAEQQGVSKSTVVEAYDRLVAEGAVEARPGSGFYAAGRVRPFALAEAGPRLDRAIDPLWIVRQSLERRDPAQAGLLQPGCGWLPDDWLPGDMIRRSLRAIARDAGANLTGYSTPQGYRPLRDHLARRLDERGLDAGPGSILLTDSGSRAIDLVCRFLLQPGDAVLVDDPCYFNFQSMLQAQRARPIGVPYTPDGPDLERFAALCAEHRPKLYLTTAVLHNPTGATVGAGVAHRLLKLAERHDLILVEDNIFADFEARPSPGLAALDGLERVIHLGSFSKTLTAALRCGYVVARADWIEGLTDLALATSFGASDMAAQTTFRLLTDGSYRRHLDTLRPRLARAMARTLQQLTALGLTPFVEPEAGMFLWMRLPEGLDSGPVARRALDEGVVLAPGDVFSVSRGAGRFMRFNAAQCGDGRVFEVLARAMAQG
ncbi:aminotransferase-like domain-containing protein [Labrys monachus]|uniref:DNA-binding transcriptional MocR family regulator n=1 Tax=Labrys monachus TaxID=217067 RepID=A0ABU0F9F2_9HYPH|nr:PLP-dependent aminotransferase family protein [Labrys monachus]MDQ0391241.1 DNA-binding transcriptional MocR family regulator [Labrys monachus]